MSTYLDFIAPQAMPHLFYSDPRKITLQKIKALIVYRMGWFAMCLNQLANIYSILTQNVLYLIVLIYTDINCLNRVVKYNIDILNKNPTQNVVVNKR